MERSRRALWRGLNPAQPFVDDASGGPALHGVEDDEVVVTGELAVEVHATVPAGVELVAVTRATARDARKTTVVGALLDRGTGIRLATSTSTWLTIPKALAP